jgi:MinD-like ATPase involved in chromosome partitioning or flagellar assembly
MPNRVIAVAGAKGSPGCSFLAMALARCLAANQVSTLLVDADAEGGGLATLLDLAPADMIAGHPIGAPAIQIDKHLWFAELGPPAPEAPKGLAWTTDVRRGHDAVVIDLGHAAGGLQQELSAASDWLLWVVVPDRSGLQRADLALQSGMLGAARAGIVFNRIRRGCLDGAEAALSSRHQLSVMCRINEDRLIAERLTRGLPVHRLWSLRRTLRDLAKSVHPDAASAVPAWRQ